MCPNISLSLILISVQADFPYGRIECSVLEITMNPRQSLPLQHPHGHILLWMPCYLVGQVSLIGFVSKPFRVVFVPNAGDIEVADRHGQNRFELQLS